MKFLYSKNQAFSLIELLTAMTILSILMLLMTQLLDQVQKSWRFGEDRISQFREARVAFDLMTKNMAQATTNTYFDFKVDEETNEVEGFEKRSELHFYVEELSGLPKVGRGGGDIPVTVCFFRHLWGIQLGIPI